MHRVAMPVKLITGAGEQVAPSGAAGPLSVAGNLVVKLPSNRPPVAPNVPVAMVVTAVDAVFSLVRSMHVPVAVKPPAGPEPAMEQPSPSMSIHLADAVSVLKSRIWSNSATTKSPGLKTPLPAHIPKVPPLVSDQLLVCTGTVTSEFAVPLVHVSATPSPTVTSTRVEASLPNIGGPGGQPGFGRLQVADESLVSAISLMVKSEPPLESTLPIPHAVCVTLTVNPSAGTQKFGELNPPGNGTTTSWTQSGGLAALTSSRIVPPAGNGKGANVYVCSAPPLTCVIV